MSLSLVDYEEMQAKKKFENEEENRIIEKLDNPSELSEFEKMDILEKALIYMQTDWQVVSDYLEDSYSRFLFHKDTKQMTPRETILYLFDNVFNGFSGGEFMFSSIKENNCYLQDLWNLYKKMMKESSFTVSKQRASYDYFKKFFENAFVVRDYRGTDLLTGKRSSTKKLVKNLPPFQTGYSFLYVDVVREKMSQNS